MFVALGALLLRLLTLPALLFVRVEVDEVVRFLLLCPLAGDYTLKADLRLSLRFDSGKGLDDLCVRELFVAY